MQDGSLLGEATAGRLRHASRRLLVERHAELSQVEAGENGCAAAGLREVRRRRIGHAVRPLLDLQVLHQFIDVQRELRLEALVLLALLHDVVQLDQPLGKLVIVNGVLAIERQQTSLDSLHQLQHEPTIVFFLPAVGKA